MPFYTFITCTIFSLAWLLVMLMCGRCIMYLFFITIIGGFGVATCLLWSDTPKLAFFTGIACAATLVWACSLRARLDFASKTLQIACHIVLEYFSLVLAAIFVMVLNGIYLIFWILAVIGLILKFKYEIDDDEHVGTDIFWSMATLLLFFLWTAEVLKNIVMVTTMSTTADWWYGHEGGGVVAHNLCRATTYNLGAITFGSLLVAIVETIEAMMSFVIKELKETENSCLVCVLRAAECVLHMLRCCIEYMTSYAYVFVGIFGSGFISAGMDVLKLISDDLAVMVINDSLVSTICFVGQLLITAIGCVTSLYLVKNQTWADGIPDAATNLTFVGGCIGWTVGAVVFGLILAANKAALVLWKQKPHQLKHRHEAFYEDLHAIWTNELGKTELEVDATDP